MEAIGHNSRRVPLAQRKRTECSCDRCKSRKQKCHRIPGQAKCRHCQNHGYECTTTKPRKQRLYGSVDHFRSRLSVLEGLVKGLIPEADLSSVDNLRHVGQSLGIPLPPADLLARESHEETPEASERSRPDTRRLVHDLQGQGQYIGPASSYFFQMKLRTLFGRDGTGPRGRMYLFGQNPMTADAFSSISDLVDCLEASPQSASEAGTSPAGTTPRTLPDASLIDTMVRSYFDYVNVDFPVLHEATFWETFDHWRAGSSAVDKSWLCGLFCVLILARRVSPVPVSLEQEERWWLQVQSLLASVMFTSSVHSVQAMMLAALHLHNTNHRDACWTLTGAAVRIAFAIGLHRDEVESQGPRQARELRKSLWWTLYGFEQMQVSSHDRPSAIEDALCSTKSPHERALSGGASYGPPDYMYWWTRLMVLMGLVCRNLSNAAAVEDYAGPLSPAAGLLRDLTRWHDSLPPHLSMQVFDAQPPTFQRSVILLHIQYHYTVSLLTRSGLLYHFNHLTRKGAHAKFAQNLQPTADICSQSGRSACELLLKMDSVGKFNAVIWWDIYYAYSSTLVLALTIICDLVKGCHDASRAGLQLLHDCATMAGKYLESPMIPGTMHRWASVVCELDVMAQDFLHRKQNHHPTEPDIMTANGLQQDQIAPSGIIAGSNEARNLIHGMVEAASHHDRLPPSVLNEAGLSWRDIQWDDIGSMLLGGEDVAFWDT